MTREHGGAVALVSAAEFRHAMGHFATGVTVVTTATADGRAAGTTVSAVSSLSLDPPLVLVCLDRASLTLQAIRQAGAFTINMLADRQQHLAVNFARRGRSATWEGVRHHMSAASGPRLDGALASVECTVQQRIPGGDHEIIVGRVSRADASENDAGPLLYWRGACAGLRR
jgi:4-nitrophenol 2-monooxygenase / 4-nitrocatechol 4-monooxygenase, reductase component